MKPRVVFSDFDGTLTDGLNFKACFFNILEILQEHKIPLVIISGRSFSWGQFLLTHFPLNDIIMEGGGVHLHKIEGELITQKTLVGAEELEKLEDITNNLLDTFPDIPLTPDSFGRLTDRAILLRELKGPKKQEIEAFLKENDADFSYSSVHLNYWVGNISKAKGALSYLEKMKLETKNLSEYLFFGDNLNDQSMFKVFPNSVGVSSINEVLDKLAYKPKVILKGKENAGPLGVYNYLAKLLA